MQVAKMDYYKTLKILKVRLHYDFVLLNNLNLCNVKSCSTKLAVLFIKLHAKVNPSVIKMQCITWKLGIRITK